MVTKLKPVKFKKSELTLEEIKYVSRPKKLGDIFVAQIRAKQHNAEFFVYLHYSNTEGLSIYDPFVTHPKDAVRDRLMVMRYGRDLHETPEEWPVMILEKLLKWGFRFLSEVKE